MFDVCLLGTGGSCLKKYEVGLGPTLIIYINKYDNTNYNAAKKFVNIL